MSRTKPKKSTAFSRFLIASIICGTAFGFTGRAYAEDPVQPGGEALYLANANSISANVFAAGSKAYGVYANGAGKTIDFAGEAISLGVAPVTGYGLIGFFAKDVGTDAANAIALGSDTKTNFVVINATGDDSTHVRGMRVKNSIVNVKGVYFGMYASTGANDDVYGVETKTGGIVNLSSENSVISVTGGSTADDDAIGLYANGGTITVNGNLYVNASTAVAATGGGTVTTDADKQTVLNGNISSIAVGGTVNANLTGENSSWTGNVTDSTGTVNVNLKNGATWTPTTLTTTAAVDILTMGGTAGGFIEMRDNQGGGTAATAKVDTITGNGTAHMDVNDTLEVGTISNSGLTVFGGKLDADTIKSNATVTLDGVNVIDNLTVNGVLNGKNVVFAGNTKLAVGYETDATTSGSATFTGDTTTVYDVEVSGATGEGKTGTVTFNAKQTYAHSLKANQYGSIVANGNLTTKRNITAAGGDIILKGATKVGGYDGIAAGSSDLVARNNGTITVTGDLTADDIKVSGTNSKVTINKNGGATVKLGGADRSGTPASGDIEMNGGTVNINLDNGASSWYGNVACNNDSDLDVVLANGAKWTGNVITNSGDMALTLANGGKWNATKLDTVAAVTSLTMNRGVISMKNQTEEAATVAQEAAIAKVGTLTGTEGLVKMNAGDVFEFGVENTVDALKINGGTFGYSGEVDTATAVAADNTLTLDGVHVNFHGHHMNVYGTLNAENTTFNSGTALNVAVKTEETPDATKEVNASATFTGTTTTLREVVAEGGTKNITGEGKDAVDDTKTATITFDSTNTSAKSLTANAYGVIDANKALTTEGNITANNGGEINLKDNTRVGNFMGADLQANDGGTINVTGNLTVGTIRAAGTQEEGKDAVVGTVNIFEADNNAITVGTQSRSALVNAAEYGTVNIVLGNEASSWTGNVSGSAGTVNVALADGAKWNVKGNSGVAAVDTLTLNGGVVNMKHNFMSSDTAVVEKLVGTNGTVIMGSAQDMLDVTTIGNAPVDDAAPAAFKLDVTGGRLNGDTILDGAVVKLDGTKVVGSNPLLVNGKLIGTNVTATAQISVDNDGLVVLKGDTADVKTVATYNTSKAVINTTGNATIEKINDESSALEALGGEIITLGGTTTITGNVYANNGGKITLNGGTTNISAGKLSASQLSTIDVTSNLSATNTGHDVIDVDAGGTINVNIDGKHKTVLDGNISVDIGGGQKGTANIDLTFQDNTLGNSSWTGNVTQNAGTLNIDLGGNTWNVTKLTNDPGAITSLTVNGGIIDMTSATGAVAAVAKVTKLSGSKATVNMNADDFFSVGINSNEDLTINGGSLSIDGVKKDNKLTINKTGDVATTVTSAVTNAGTIDAKNTTFNETVTNNAVIDATGSTFGGAVTNTGIINLTGATTISNAVSGAGVLNINGGTTTATVEKFGGTSPNLTLDTKITNKINVANGAELDILAGNVGNAISNRGTVVLKSATHTGGETTVDAEKDALTNTLTNTITGGTIKVDDAVTAGAADLAGDVYVKDGKTLTLNSGTFAGTVKIESGDYDKGNVTTTGTVTAKSSQLNQVGGKLTNEGILNLTGDFSTKDVANSGTLNLTGDLDNINIGNSGTVNLTGDLNGASIDDNGGNTGTINLLTDTKANGSSIEGTLNANGKTIDMTDGNNGALCVNSLNTGSTNKIGLKIDVQLGTTGNHSCTYSDKIQIMEGGVKPDSNVTINLESINIAIMYREDDSSLVQNAVTYVDTSRGTGTDNATYTILGKSDAGTQLNVFTSDGKTTVFQLGSKGHLSIDTTVLTGDAKKISNALESNVYEGLSLVSTSTSSVSSDPNTVDVQSINVVVSSDSKAKDIYLNNNTLKSTYSTTHETTLNVTTGTVNIYRGTLGHSGDTDSSEINLNVTGGTLNLIDGVTVYGDLDIGTSAAVNSDGDVAIYGSVDNDNTATFNGITVIYDVVDNDGTMEFNGHTIIKSSVDNSGTMTLNGGTNSITGNVTNTGTFSATGITNTITGNLINGEANTTNHTATLEGTNVVTGSVSNNTFDTITFKGNTTIGTRSTSETIVNAKRGTMNFEGSTNIEAAITNEENAVINISNGSFKTNEIASIEGKGEMHVTNADVTAGAIVQLHKVTLDSDSSLNINAEKLQSNVTNNGVVILTGDTGNAYDTLDHNYVISGGEIDILNMVQANVNSLRSNTIVLDAIDKAATLSLTGTGALDAAVSAKGNKAAKLYIDGTITSRANTLNVNTEVNADHTLQLTAGTLADDVVIEGKGALVVDGGAGITARVQDLQVTGGIKNETELELTGEGKLKSTIKGDGKLTVTGIVDAEKYGISQDQLVIGQTGKLTVKASEVVVDDDDIVNDGDLVLKGNGYFNEGVRFAQNKGTVTVASGAVITTSSFINNNLVVDGNMTINQLNVLTPGQQHVNGTIVVNEQAVLNLNAKYTYNTAIQNAGELNVSVDYLKADVDNFKFYEVEHDVDQLVEGTVNLSGKGTLTQKVLGGNLNVNDDIKADADNVAAHNTYIANGKTLTLNGDGTLLGNLKTVETGDKNGKVVVDANVVANGVINAATTVNAGKSLTIDADNVGADVILKEDNTNKKYGKLFLGEGELTNTVTGGNIILQGDVTTTADKLVANHFIRLSDTQDKKEVGHVLTIGGEEAAELDVVIGSNDYHYGTLATANTKGLTLKKAVWTDIANTGILTTNVANINAITVKEGAAPVVKTIDNDGTLTLTGGTPFKAATQTEAKVAEKADAINSVISGDGTLVVDGILSAANAITQREVTINADKSLAVAGVDLTADLITNKGTLRIAADKLKGVVDNQNEMYLRQGELNYEIKDTNEATDNSKLYVKLNVTSNAAIQQDNVDIEAGKSLTMVDADLTAAVNVDDAATLAIDAKNLKGAVANAGKVELGYGLLADGSVITGGDIKLTNSVATVGTNLVGNNPVDLNGNNLFVIDGAAHDKGNLTVDIGSAEKATGKLVIIGNTALVAAENEGAPVANVWTNIVVAKGGTLNANVANIKESSYKEGKEPNVETIYTTIANDGILNLKGGTAGVEETPAVADAISRVIDGNGTLNIKGILKSENAITQGIVNIEAGKSLDMDGVLTATDYVYVKAAAEEVAGGILEINADNLNGLVANLGTLNLGEGELEKGIVGVAPEGFGSVYVAKGTTNIEGNVTSKTHIAQNVVSIKTGNTLTMNADAVLYAEEKVSVAESAVLKVAAADLYGDVELAKATTEGKDNGKIELGTGTLFKTITGGDVVLTGNVTTVGGNLKNVETNGTNDLTVNLAGQNLYITSGDLDVVVNNTNTEAGALVIQGTTTANEKINAAVGVATTGALSVDAGNLTAATTTDDVANTVINYGTVNLTGTNATLGKSIEGTGVTNINGTIVGGEGKNIAQNTVNIGEDKSLTMNGYLLAQVNISAKDTGAKAGELTIGASNLLGAVANEGTLNLTGGTFTGLDESYTGFVASINGTGTTNTNGAVTTEQKIVQKNINVQTGSFTVAEDTRVQTTGSSKEDGATNVAAGATMNVRADDIKGYIVNSGTTNFVVGTEKTVAGFGRLHLRGGATLTNNAGGTVNFGKDGDATQEFSIWSEINNSGIVNIYTSGDGKASRIHRDIVNTGTINTYGDITLHSNVSIDGDTPEGAEKENHGWLVVNSGTLTFTNTTAGSLNTNVEIKKDATLDPLARVLAEDIIVNDYGTLKVDGTDPVAITEDSDLEENKLAATINVKGTGTMELINGSIVLGGGTINQEVNTTLQATGNVATTPVIQGVNSVDQLNVGGSILKLTGEVTGIAKEQQYALVQGKAVKDVVAQDLLLNKKLWRTVEMAGKDAQGNPVTVSNDNPNANFVTDYFLSNDGTAIVAEVRTIKTIDEVNTNGLAGVQQGALAMTNQMNDKVAENMSLVERPAVEKGKKYDKQIWASYINTKEDVEERELWNMKADNTAKYSGAMVGVDFYSSQKAIAGLALSYATGDITANTANRTHVQNDAKYYGVTLYDRVTNGNVAWTYDLGYQNGKNEISMNARENITADVKTNAYTAGIRVEGAIEAGKNSVFAPFASVRYTRLNTGDYTNSNGSKFDSNSQNFFIPKVGVAWKGNYGDSVKGWAFNPILEIGYMFNAGSRNAETQYLSSTGHMFNSEYDVVDSGTYYGRIGMNFVNHNFSFGLNYRYLKGSTTKNNRWNVNLGYKF